VTTPGITTTTTMNEADMKTFSKPRRRDMRTVPIGRRVAVAATCAALAVATAGCGDDDASGDAAATAATTEDQPSTVAVSDPPATTAPPSDPPATPAPTTAAATVPATTPASDPTSPPTTSDDELAAHIEAVLAKAIAPGSIRWDLSGVDVPPTAAVAAVRIPGRDDVLVAVGDNVDGSPAEAGAPFPVGPLTDSLVRTVAFQLIDDGLLNPALTVDQWVPTLPNADRVTVQMVIDNETGWSDVGPIEPDPLLTDLERAWSLREAIELRATAMTALAEPGTPTNDGLAGEAVMGLVVEEVAGRPLAELIRDRVSGPAGLDDTGLLDGRITPPGYRHGMLAVSGTALDTSMFPGVSHLTWHQATSSVVSTPRDLLDLLDVWASGELFTTDRAPAPHRYTPDPAGNPNTNVGLGVPFNAYCPCTDVDGGIEPTAIGRAPSWTSLGTKTILWRYTDGISIVINFNSGGVADPAEIEVVTTALHDLAAAGR
jgi:CubicO group peptidase (beta-lactamase class C family)